jgi:hypothetical protein
LPKICKIRTFKNIFSKILALKILKEFNNLLVSKKNDRIILKLLLIIRRESIIKNIIRKILSFKNHLFRNIDKIEIFILKLKRN